MFKLQNLSLSCEKVEEGHSKNGIACAKLGIERLWCVWKTAKSRG